MTMTAEQLEELANGFATHLHSEETIQHLARRVICAEKLAEALDRVLCYSLCAADRRMIHAALTAYREASK